MANKNEILYLLLFLISTLNVGLSQDCKLKLSGFNQESNIAYLGVNNSILGKTDKLLLSTNNGEIKINNNQLIYRPNYIGQAIIISNPITTMDVIDAVDTCDIQVKYLPFTFHIGNVTSFFANEIEIKKEDLQNTYFSMLSTNTNISAQAKILGFNIIVERDNNKEIEKSFSNYDAETRNKIFRIFELLEKDDIIIVDKLEYKYMDDHIIEHHKIKITVN